MPDYKKIILKNSSVPNAVPLASFLDSGEIALNYADKKIYYKDANGNVVVHETPGIAVDSAINSIVKRDGNGSGNFAGVISSVSDPGIYCLEATHSDGVAAKIISEQFHNAIEITAESGIGAFIEVDNGIGASMSSNSGVGASISSSSATGAQIVSDTGTGASISSDSGTGATISSDSGTGAYITSASGIALNVYSSGGDGVYITSDNTAEDAYALAISANDAIGLTIATVNDIGADIHSKNDFGAEIYTEDGPYNVAFGNRADSRQLAVSAPNCTLDWLNLVNEDVTTTGSLQIETLTANRNWTLPNASGTIVLDTAIDTTVTGSGKTFTSADSGKIFHVSGTNTLTLPAWTSVSFAWCIGIVNTGGNTLTFNIESGSGNTINDATTITNTVKFSSIYIYRSPTTDQFIALGTLY